MGNVKDKDPDCVKNNMDKECWRNFLTGVLVRGGVDSALGTLGELYKMDTNFASYCHDAAHELGRKAH